MNNDLSMFSLIAEASLVVQLVMLLLLVVSIVSWTIIIHKWRLLKSERRAAELFEGRFWSGIDLVELYRQLKSQETDRNGLSAIFEAGFGEFARLTGATGAGSNIEFIGMPGAFNCSVYDIGVAERT